MEFEDFKVKFENILECTLNESGYILGIDDHRIPIRNLAYFANKERKFVKELSEGRERGTWINTFHKDVAITTAQTNVISDFINKCIEVEELNPHNIIMLKYLKLIDDQVFSIYKIFKSVDVRDKATLFHRINAYDDGFFGQNEDYSEDVNRLELDHKRDPRW